MALPMLFGGRNMDDTGDNGRAQIRRITVAEFRKSAADVLKRAREGEQTIVEDVDGKPQMVIGINRHPVIIEKNNQIEEVEDLPNCQVDASHWLR